MSASWPVNMRGPRLRTPLLLLLLLLLLTSLTATGQEDGSTIEDAQPTTTTTEPVNMYEDTEQTEEPPTEVTSEGSGSGTAPTELSTSSDPSASPEDDQELSPMIILIPVVLVVLIIGMIVCGIFINRRWNKNARNQELSKEDPYLDGSCAEKVPMPMFEEDVPSVLELEMEELDQWMKKDGENAEDSTHA